MELYGQQSKSWPQKITVHILEIGLLYLSYWLLFQNGGHWISEWLHIENNQDAARRTIIFIFNIVIFLRMSYMMIFLLQRKMPWEESVSVPFAFALYYIGFSLLVLPTSRQIGIWDIIAIILFIVGCVLNTGGELLRKKWKEHPENKGQIYTEGFFRYSRHVNYFGDLLWVSAYAVLTANWWSVTIPVLLFLFFAFYNAPKLDEYLKQKYGKGYDEYAKKTKMLIPYIY
ncbi:MAG: isoprenylcysteine carboxylmethyltransferase family protein [Saprospiraceae bacterium]|nr:isoprenylcysteine carboxylmethyltransferase family protein [Lewinella sp.]